MKLLLRHGFGPRAVRSACLAWGGATLLSASVAAQDVPAPDWAGPPIVEPPTTVVAPVVPPLSKPAGDFELGTAYAAAVLYGVGFGLWIDAEADIRDPASFLLAPTLLGVLAPLGVRLANSPRMLRGKAASVSAGVAIGALEGLALGGVATSRSGGSWSFRSATRALAIGTTIGGAGGVFLGEAGQPSPRTSAFVLSGCFWGAWLGGLAGLASAGPGRARSGGQVGAVVGLNVGLLSTLGLSTLFVPKAKQLKWMWAGAGIGTVVSTPVFPFYLRDNSPPLRRGLMYTAATSGLGILAGGVFGPELSDYFGSWMPSNRVRFHALAPLIVPGGAGLSLVGSLL